MTFKLNSEQIINHVENIEDVLGPDENRFENITIKVHNDNFKINLKENKVLVSYMSNIKLMNPYDEDYELMDIDILQVMQVKQN